MKGKSDDLDKSVNMVRVCYFYLLNKRQKRFVACIFFDGDYMFTNLDGGYLY